MTAFGSSRIPCLANFPGKKNRTAVCIPREERVDILFSSYKRHASEAILSNTSFTNEIMIDIALLETPDDDNRVGHSV